MHCRTTRGRHGEAIFSEKKTLSDPRPTAPKRAASSGFGAERSHHDGKRSFKLLDSSKIEHRTFRKRVRADTVPRKVSRAALQRDSLLGKTFREGMLLWLAFPAQWLTDESMKLYCKFPPFPPETSDGRDAAWPNLSPPCACFGSVSLFLRRDSLIHRENTLHGILVRFFCEFEPFAPDLVRRVK